MSSILLLFLKSSLVLRGVERWLLRMMAAISQYFEMLFVAWPASGAPEMARLLSST